MLIRQPPGIIFREFWWPSGNESSGNISLLQNTSPWDAGVHDRFGSLSGFISISQRGTRNPKSLPIWVLSVYVPGNGDTSRGSLLYIHLDVSFPGNKDTSRGIKIPPGDPVFRAWICKWCLDGEFNLPNNQYVLIFPELLAYRDTALTECDTNCGKWRPT